MNTQKLGIRSLLCIILSLKIIIVFLILTVVVVIIIITIDRDYPMTLPEYGKPWTFMQNWWWVPQFQIVQFVTVFIYEFFDLHVQRFSQVRLLFFVELNEASFLAFFDGSLRLLLWRGTIGAVNR